MSSLLTTSHATKNTVLYSDEFCRDGDDNDDDGGGSGGGGSSNFLERAENAQCNCQWRQSISSHVSDNVRYVGGCNSLGRMSTHFVISISRDDDKGHYVFLPLHSAV